MEIIGFFLLIVIIFVLLGIGGIFLKLFGFIFEILLDGIGTTIGCLFWVIIIIFFIFVVISL